MSPRHLRPSAPPRRSVAPLHRGPQATPLGSMSNTLVGGAMPPQAPNAALLIDFDNVTMGIRSDLQGELNNLLSSDIIKGKVAVRRAYADWRRYPQYIVPLTEASIDLIFAPAYGSAKKNATDIRLAIDALELVFTRPEIGTFVLLSGDSDFSSMVIKLKEYGKYVIGVGIRESSSDLLVMNCDEYYSYNALAGLVRTSDEESTRWDAYELVTEAVQRMKRNGDVMRSDRLKQVMQEIDASFDEKNLGMPKFSRFVQEAQSRGLLTVTKLENGQLEIGVPTGTPATIEAAPADAVSSAATAEGDDADERGTAQEREERRGRRGRRGRGRDRDRDERPRAGAAAEGAATAEAGDAAPSASERAQPSAPVTEAPLGAVARVSAPTASDAPLGAVARVSSPTSAPSAGGAAAAADAAPLGAVGRSSGGRDRGPRDNRGEGRGDRGPARERTDAPRQDSPRVESARTETPRAETPRAEAPRAASTDAPDTIGLGGEKLTRAEAFDLVQRAVTSLVSGNATTSAGAVRRKAFELLGRDSETLAARMFERILRDAHDADVIDLRRRGDDYEVGRVAEAATIAEQLAKKEAELAQVQKEAAKASGTAGPTGLGTRGRVAGRGGPRGGRPGGPPPELLMVGVVKAASSASASSASAPSASAPSAPPAAASAQAAPATPAAVDAEAPSSESTAPKKSGAAKKAARSAPRTSAKTDSKSDGKAAKSAAKSAKAAKSAAKTPAKTAARTGAKSSTSAAKAPVKTATKAPAKSAAKSATKSPAKKSAPKKAAKKSV